MKGQPPRMLAPDAQKIVADVYLVGSVQADPPLVLTDVARAVKIVGRMLDNLADSYSGRGKKVARLVTLAGSFLWGIVEISVPGTMLNHLSGDWYKLIALCGLVILVLGLITGTAGMVSIGVELLVAAFVVKLITFWLHRLMLKGTLGGRWARPALIAFVVAAVAGLVVWGMIAGHMRIATIFLWLSKFFANPSAELRAFLKRTCL